MKDSKKQIPLRVSEKLWEELNSWAADDFRSLNSQIEYLLTECVKRRKFGKPELPALNGTVSSVNEGGDAASPRNDK
jgi:hypothetical protein